jgi:endonuclease III
MAQQSKSQLLNEVHTLLKKRYKPKPEKPGARLTVLEAVVYGICHDGTTREQANQALSRFKDGYFDWNEVRVSSIAEIQSTLAGFTDTEGRAHRIRRFLRQLFEKTYGFTLEGLTKKPLKESLKVLADYEAFSSDYVEATVIQQALGGHAIPVDGPARRALERLGVADHTMETAALRGLLERAVPKNRGVEFGDLLEELAHDTCVEPQPDCPHCDLRKICPTAAARKEEAIASAKQAVVDAKEKAKQQVRDQKDAAKVKEKPKEPAKLPTKPAPPVKAAPAKPAPPVKPAPPAKPAQPKAPPAKPAPTSKAAPPAKPAPKSSKPKGSSGGSK